MHRIEQEHSYEELREVVIHVLLGARETGVDRFERLLEQAARELGKQESAGQDSGRRTPVLSGAPAQLPAGDVELVLEIVWDLFRQGIVTFGQSAANPGWPFLRLSRFGECALEQGPYRLHNKAEFMKAALRSRRHLAGSRRLSSRGGLGLLTDCLLSACVMLGVAAESEFLRLLDAAKSSRTYGSSSPASARG